jgi:hypothetical protein
VTTRGGRRVNRERARAPGLPVLAMTTAMALGAILSAVAWVFLVRAAVEFGRLARQGNAGAWAFTLGASVGATVCALLVLVLVARALRTVGLIRDYQPRRAGERRRSHRR